MNISELLKDNAVLLGAIAAILAIIAGGYKLIRFIIDQWEKRTKIDLEIYDIGRKRIRINIINKGKTTAYYLRLYHHQNFPIYAGFSDNPLRKGASTRIDASLINHSEMPENFNVIIKYQNSNDKKFYTKFTVPKNNKYLKKLPEGYKRVKTA